MWWLLITAKFDFFFSTFVCRALIEGSDVLCCCQLADIIWGEDSEADDQIVRYPEDTGKKGLPDHGDDDRKKLTGADTNWKAAEENASISKSFSDGGKQDSNNGVSALRTMRAQHDLPSFSTSRTDGDPIGTEIYVFNIRGRSGKWQPVGELAFNPTLMGGVVSCHLK